MKERTKMMVRGLGASMAAAAVMMASAMPAFAAPRIEVIPTSSSHTDYGAYNTNRYDNNSYNSYRRDRGDRDRGRADMSGPYGDVDYHEKSFALRMPNGDNLHIAADRAIVTIAGRPASFGDIPNDGNVQVIGYYYGDKKIRATEIRVDRGRGRADRRDDRRNRRDRYDSNNNGRYNYDNGGQLRPYGRGF